MPFSPQWGRPEAGWTSPHKCNLGWGQVASHPLTLPEPPFFPLFTASELELSHYPHHHKSI